MIVRVPSSFARWGRPSLAFALVALTAFSCTTSEDTEPFVPAVDGAMQPKGEGARIAEDAACQRLLAAAHGAYDRLNCDEPTFPDCPAFLRPGAGSGCYEYREGSIAACEEAYGDASSCRGLAPCLATAELNIALPTCEQVMMGVGGTGGGAPEGGSANLGGTTAVGGAPPIDVGGAPPVGGQSPQGGNDTMAGQPTGGSN